MRPKTNIIKILVLAFFVLAGIIFLGRLFYVLAVVPDEVNFQGKLTDINGVNVANGNYNFQVRIYDHPTNDLAPNLLYTQTLNGVAVTNGIFNLKFSPANAALNSTDTYLQVCFDSNATGGDATVGCGTTATSTSDTAFDKRFLPRKLLRSNPYSLVSKFLGSNYIQGGDGSESGALSFGGTTGISVSNAGAGKMYFDSSLNKFRCSQNGAAYVDCISSGSGTPAGSNGQVQFNNAGAFGASANLFWDNTNNRLGIGTSSPSYTLTANGDISTSTFYRIGADKVLAEAFSGSTIYVGLGAGAGGSAVNDNTLIGYQAGYNVNTPANVFIGSQAGYSNAGTFASGVIGIGRQAGYHNQGQLNVFIGDTAGYNNTTGGEAVFIGGEAGNSNTTGFANTFVGASSGQLNVNGNFNTYYGSRSGTFGTSGGDNTSIGFQAGYLNDTGSANVYLGSNAGVNATNANANTVLGGYAGGGLTSGSSNTFVGNSSGAGTITGFDNVFLGRDAGGNGDNNSNVALGANAAVGNGINGSIALGKNANATIASQLMIGGTSYPINLINVFSTGLTFSPFTSLGTNTAGPNFTLAGGQSSGTGLGGSLIFQTSPAGSSGTTTNASVTRLQIDSTGAFSYSQSSSTPSLSSAGQGKMYFNGTNFKCSENGGAYVNCVGGGGGGSAAGSNGQVQFNSSGAFGASGNFFWDEVNNRLGIGTSSPTQALDVNGNGKFSGHLALGEANVDDYFGTPASVLLNAYQTITTQSDDGIYGANIYMNVNPTTDAAHSYDWTEGAEITTRVDFSSTHTIGEIDGALITSRNSGSGSVNYINGARIAAGNDTTATVGSIIAADILAFNQGGGTVTNETTLNVGYFGSGTMTSSYGIKLQGGDSGGGDLTDAYGIYSNFNTARNVTNQYGAFFSTPYNPSNTITNNYGIYIDNQAGIGSNNSYNLYSAGSGTLNYFGGALVFGGQSAPAVSAAGTGRMYFDSGSNTFKCSENGGGYSNCIGGGGGSAAGSDGQVQFNNSGSFGASADFFWDNANGRLGILTSSPSLALDVNGDGFFAGTLNIGTGFDASRRLNVFDDRSTSGSAAFINLNASGNGDGDYYGGLVNADNNADQDNTKNLAGLKVTAHNNNLLNAFSGGRVETFNSAATTFYDGFAGYFVNESTGTIGTGQMNGFAMTAINRSTTQLGNVYALKGEARIEFDGQSDNLYGVIASAGPAFTNPGAEVQHTYGGTFNAYGGIQTNTGISATATDANGVGGYFQGSSLALDINGAANYRGISAPSVSAGGQGTMYYDSGANKFKCSENSGAYFDCFGAGGSPAGSDGELQFNNSGSFGASSNLFWDSTNSRLGIGTSSPSQTLDVNGTAIFSGHTAFGNATSIDSSPFLTNINVIENNSTAGSGVALRGISSKISLQTTASNGPNTWGMDTDVEVDNDKNFTSITGLRSTVNLNGSGSILQSFGIDSSTYNEASTLTNTYGGRFGVGTNDGNITNAYGIRITAAYTGTATITNNYGLYLEAQTIGTNKYNLYSAGTTSTNYFDGSLLFGGPTSAPTVSGSNQGKIYYDNTADKFKCSENNGAYFDCFNSSTVSGSATAGQVTYWNGTSSLAGSTNFTWDNTNSRLNIGASTATAALAVKGGDTALFRLTGNFGGSSASEVVMKGFPTFSNRTLVFDRSLSSDGWAIETTLQNGTAGSPLYLNPRGGNISIGTTSTPNYKLDVSTSSSNTQIRFGSSASDVGGYLVSAADDQAVFAGGSSWNGSTWVAKATSAENITVSGGNFNISLDTGLTIGNGFTPTTRLSITPTAFTAGLGSTSGTTTIDIGGTGTGNAVCHSGTNTTTDNVGIVDCTSAPAADYMEMYSVDPNVQTGDIVVTSNNYITTKDGEKLSKLSKSNVNYASNIIGVMSDKSKAGDFNSIGYNILDSDNPQPIALNGRVYINIDNLSDAINTGDLITSSMTPGKGMKATGSGFVVAKALESWTPNSGKTKILAFISNTYYNPNISADNWSLGSQGLETTQNVVVHGSLNSDSLKIGNNVLNISANGNLNTVGNISSQDIISKGLLTANKAMIDDLTVNKITVATSTVIGDPTIGSGTLIAGTTKITITNSNIKTSSKVIITPRSKTNSVLAVTNIMNGQSFNVETTNISAQDINFDYWIVLTN